MTRAANRANNPKTPINCLRKRFAALGGAQKLAYLIDMSRFLRFIRLATHLAR